MGGAEPNHGADGALTDSQHFSQEHSQEHSQEKKFRGFLW